jgi:hypothetical protein
MNSQILESLKGNRQMVENRYNGMIKNSQLTGSSCIASKKFFFEVVASHFENMSSVMVNKVIKGGHIVFVRELNKAVESAEYSCAKPAREYNKQFFILK